MPSREPKFHSHLTAEVQNFWENKKRQLNGTGTSGNVQFLNAIEFIDQFKLLPNGLFPVQRFIVKLYYNIPLDDTDKVIKITDKFNTQILHEFTEKEYLRYLYDQGRCNIGEQDGKERRELILVLGRRSGKSELSSIFASYEIYKLLRRGYPQNYYGMPPGAEIRVMCIANDKEQASIVYGSMQGHIEAVDYFKNAQANVTQTFMKFRTESDRKKYGESGKATITATFKSSIAKGLRGRGIMCAILDEIAFFVEDGKSGAEQVYRAISPSLAQFAPKDPSNTHKAIGDTDGRMILISSPDAREGFFYRLYQKAMSNDKGSRNMLVIQAPTWEVRTDLPTSYYESEYHKDPKKFMTEHGAEFSDRVRGWIEDWKELENCIVPELRPAARGYPREAHFAGVDFGISGDGTAIALTHFNRGKVELAYHEVWYPKVKWRDANPHLPGPMVPYAYTLENVSRLDLDEISEWFRALSTKFYIQNGVFDQWAGPVFEQVLHKRGLVQFTMHNFTPGESSSMYNNFKMLMSNNQFAIYDYPLPEAMSEGMSLKHSPLITELLELQAHSAGKNIVIVQAPEVQGKHDDQSDALARSIYLALEYARSHPGIFESSARQVAPIQNQVRPVSYHQYQRQKARMHGVIRERMAPRIPKR